LIFHAHTLHEKKLVKKNISEVLGNKKKSSNFVRNFEKWFAWDIRTSMENFYY